jgi:hypothetical protein
MARLLGTIAVVALAMTLGSAILAIWLERDAAARFLDLTRILLSWPVLGTGLAFGAGSAFSDEIKGVLKRLAR